MAVDGPVYAGAWCREGEAIRWRVNRGCSEFMGYGLGSRKRETRSLELARQEKALGRQRNQNENVLVVANCSQDLHSPPWRSLPACS